MRSNLRFPDNQIPIKTINGITPDQNGNIVLNLDSLSNSSSSSGGGDACQAILSAKIPTDEGENNLHITVQLSQNPSFSGYIELTDTSDYSRMMVAQDSDFSQLSNDGIYPAFYGGILIITLDSDINGFDPNLAWYARIRWSNGEVTNPWRLTRFLHNGHISETD